MICGDCGRDVGSLTVHHCIPVSIWSEHVVPVMSVSSDQPVRFTCTECGMSAVDNEVNIPHREGCSVLRRREYMNVPVQGAFVPAPDGFVPEGGEEVVTRTSAASSPVLQFVLFLLKICVGVWILFALMLMKQ